MSVRARIAIIGGLVGAFAYALFAAGGAQAQATATLIQEYSWTNPDHRFGGLSGIEMADDGLSLTAVSDRGTLWHGAIARNESGAITKITPQFIARLKTSENKPVRGVTADSEGLAIAPDGTIYVSFEGIARIAKYARASAIAERIPRLEAFKHLQDNSALEALAIDPSGALFTLPERSGGTNTPFPVWRFANGAWTEPFTVPRDGDWLPVGADFGPDGKFYLLYRDFLGILGFRTKIMRYTIEGDTISVGETLLETGGGRYDNFEGISVWRDAAGTLRVTLIADDNYAFYLRSEIAEFRITE